MAGNHFPSSSFPICMVQKININIISTFNVKPAVGLVLLPILHKLHDLHAVCPRVVQLAHLEHETELLVLVHALNSSIRWKLKYAKVISYLLTRPCMDLPTWIGLPFFSHRVALIGATVFR